MDRTKALLVTALVITVAVASVLITLLVTASGPDQAPTNGETASLPSPSEPWPPLITDEDGATLPALASAATNCDGLEVPIDALFSTIQLATDGESVTITGPTEDELLLIEPTGSSGEEALWKFECVLQRLDAPSSVWERMLSTRALDGTNEAIWNYYFATWTFHPESGLHVVISYSEASRPTP